MAAAQLSHKIQQDASFFSSMLGLIPSSYLAPPSPQENSKFMHSKHASAGLPRQSMKENSKAGQKAKQAAYDPKNYTSLLSNGKSSAQDSDSDEEEDDEDDDEQMAESDEEEDEDSEEEEEAPKSKGNKKNSPANGKSASPSSPASASTPSPSAPPSLPAPTLSSLSADIGMDQLRQRLHERISGLSQKRKPEDHPFKKKRGDKKDKDKEKKKREKNEKRPSSHPSKAEAQQPPAKKQKSAAAPSASSSSSSSSSARVADITESNDFQFAELKPLANPLAKGGSFSLQGKQQRKKRKADGDLLREVEQFEERVSELKSSGQVQVAKELEQERAMQNAMLRAKGEKIKTDKKLLKKSIKRDEKKKDKSRQAWAERTATAKKAQDAFHAEKIARASKKQKGDRSKHYAAGEEPPKKKDEESEGRGRGRGGKGGDSKGRAGFEGKKKFLN